MITIDGSFGEGGGQILRSSLALSAITGEPVRIENVRANRSKPGLLRQHLTALNAVTEICGGHTTGAELGSSEISFRPGSIRAGEYAFSVGSAGSANLVLQTILPVLLNANEPSTITIEGGTHNPSSPPFDYLSECFFPALRMIGHRVEGQLDAYGFYPAGGGKLTIRVGVSDPLQRFDRVERGSEISRSLEALIANLPVDIAKRELATASSLLDMDFETECKSTKPASRGPGNALYGRLVYEAGTVMFTQFGQKGVTSEQVGKRLAKQMKTFAASSAAVDHHLADQLLLPMALAKGGSFSTLRPSLHSTTNADVISKFTGRKIEFVASSDRTLCRVV
ncbi:MAG: RNA 3'-terminal phosphate cyclase [Henriciella sp.]